MVLIQVVSSPLVINIRVSAGFGNGSESYGLCPIDLEMSHCVPQEVTLVDIWHDA